ncbi:MAG: hypothetical protein LBV40_04500 [Methanomicrobiales archaeon]|jgi:hypothetical protein|nr:hypothetical protein [Methanomicrobiales archaeon]
MGCAQYFTFGKIYKKREMEKKSESSFKRERFYMKCSHWTVSEGVADKNGSFDNHVTKGTRCLGE